MIRQRHDRILERLRKATEHGNVGKIVLINQKPAGYSENVKPDITILNETNKTVKIVDLAVAFEDAHHNALDATRQMKIQKYQPLADWYTSKGYQVALDAVVYGSLGATHPNNACVLTSILKIQKKFAEKMQQYITVDLIRDGTLIWILHYRGH